MMDMHSRNQYLEELRKEYLKASKKEKSRLLDEAKKRTGLNQKYLIRKLRPGNNLKPKPRRRRKETYDGYVRAALARLWEIFDYPCGQRLEPLLRTEVERLRALGELSISDEVAHKLRKISSKTIDRKLQHQKEVLHLRRNRHPKTQPLLYQKIPVKLIDEWDKEELGNCQLDFVAHCGSSAFGDFINSLGATEISSQWWEAEAIIGRAQGRVKDSLSRIKGRSPFAIKEIHPDNDSGIINQLVYRWTQEEGISFSRSRPNKKNDNAYIEQKNWTHVRKIFGYLRYDTEEELAIINDLYRNELRLYKNFFQPVIKLVSKERRGSRIHRRYDVPKTPYQRLIAMESNQVEEEMKEELKALYLCLNPAELKRKIDLKLKNLYRVYQAKNRTLKVEPKKKLKSRLVTSYMTQPAVVRLPG
jgi:hypothetical protein